MKLLKDYFDAKRPQNMYPKFGFYQLESLSRTCDNNNNPPTRTILAAAILLTLIGGRIGRQTALDIFFQDHGEVRSE